MTSRRGTLTTRGGAFVGSGIVLVAGGVLLGLVDLTRAGTLLLAAAAAALFVVPPRRLSFGVSRRVKPDRVSVGEAATVTVLIRPQGRWRAPAGLAEEHLPAALGARPRVLIGPLARSGGSRFQYTVRPQARGIHRVGPLHVEAVDSFGLTSRSVATSGEDALVVLPRVHPLQASRHLLGGAGSEGPIPRGPATRGEDDQTVRVYREGDDLRRIHWPATARTGELMVRQEDRPTRRQALILLDSRASAYPGPQGEAAFEWAVSMAASVAAHLARQAYSVRMVTADSATPAGARVDEDLDATLLRLAGIDLTPGSSVRPVLHLAQEASAGCGLVVAIVAGFDDDTIRVLASLRPHGAHGLAFVLHPGGPTDPGGAAGGSAHRRASATLAGLRASGWGGTAVGDGASPAQVWAAATATATGALR